jgi:hypothetical protein
MRRRLVEPGLSFDCRIIDIREIDSEPLIASASLEDNVIALLTRLGTEREAVRRILRHISTGGTVERESAVAELLILAGLRKPGTFIEREIERMPILDDIMDHEVIGRERKRGMALGREEGLAEGLVAGERRVVLRLIGKRFGGIPEWVKQRLDTLSEADLEQIELRLLDAPTLEELFNLA